MEDIDRMNSNVTLGIRIHIIRVIMMICVLNMKGCSLSLRLERVERIKLVI